MPGHENSIKARSHKAAKDYETLLWRAFCDVEDDEDAATAMEYIEKDCVIMNPLLHPKGTFDALSAESDPPLEEVIENLAKSKRPWIGCKMWKHDPEPAIAEVEMMAVQIMYRVTVMVEGKKGKKGEDGKRKPAETEEIEAMATSTWRQGAGGDWKLCAQMVVPT